MTVGVFWDNLQIKFGRACDDFTIDQGQQRRRRRKCVFFYKLSSSSSRIYKMWGKESEWRTMLVTYQIKLNCWWAKWFGQWVLILAPGFVTFIGIRESVLYIFIHHGTPNHEKPLLCI